MKLFYNPWTRLLLFFLWIGITFSSYHKEETLHSFKKSRNINWSVYKLSRKNNMIILIDKLSCLWGLMMSKYPHWQIWSCLIVYLGKNGYLAMLSITLTAWKLSKYGVFSGSYFPAFGLNTERHSVSHCIQSKCGKIRTVWKIWKIQQKLRYLDTFHAVPALLSFFCKMNLSPIWIGGVRGTLLPLTKDFSTDQCFTIRSWIIQFRN